MLAPTRDLVAALNRRARTHRLADIRSDTDAEVALADGNHASVGDLVITRSNDGQLRLTATDWVKNGDRWTVHAISGNGDLDVQHLRNRHRVRLPAAYVQTSAELGYATTVHGPRDNPAVVSQRGTICSKSLNVAIAASTADGWESVRSRGLQRRWEDR